MARPRCRSIRRSRSRPPPPSIPPRVTAATILLYRGEVALASLVPVRFVLSASGKSLAVIPYSSSPNVSALDYSTNYTLVVDGLFDVFRGAIAVPETTFRTKDNIPTPMTAASSRSRCRTRTGLVHVSAPECPDPNNLGIGCFYPGTSVLIINSANGYVVSLSAGNNGQIPASGNPTDDTAAFPATINDELIVTVDDPFGNTSTFSISQYTGPDGETAVGPRGAVSSRAPRAAASSSGFPKAPSARRRLQDRSCGPGQRGLHVAAARSLGR